MTTIAENIRRYNAICGKNTNNIQNYCLLALKDYLEIGR